MEQTILVERDGAIATVILNRPEKLDALTRWHKKIARRLRDAKPLTAEEYDEGFARFGTEDFRVGYRAFLAKQKPEFKGK